MRNRRFWVASLLASCLVPQAWAQAHPAVGAWIGQVSWSTQPVFYSWQINADGTFSSGRFGRGHDGGGVWRVNGDRLTLKYGDGFRYEGTLSGDSYSGSALHADGREIGRFSMSRASDDADELAEDY
ncbi:MAG: hypothetical protein K2P70_17865 [Hyphomonadaceae bacterium]|nr:hypothetical protein [Hyphomonadaceae bacterium]